MRTVARIVTAAVVAAAAIVALPAAPGARDCQSWGASPPAVGSEDNGVLDVAAAGPCLAWAVGSRLEGGVFRTLIYRWNGSTWKVVASPNRGASHNQLSAVDVVAPDDAWAVGWFVGELDHEPLVLHWNGRRWKVVDAPLAIADSFNDLFDVDATSATNAWAVGERDDPDGSYRAYVIRWDGRRWRLQRTPNVPGDADELFGVGAVSPTEAWAVGYADGETLILGWNGRRWRRVPSPSPGLSANLEDATSLRDGTSWAVGSFNDGTGDEPLILRWNGSRWKRQAAPRLEDGGTLRGVAAASSRNAWAVGADANAFPQAWLVLHWNGRSWRRASTPLVGSGQSSLILNGVARVPGDGAWAVGGYLLGGRRLPYALHCC
jgi:hypothetical protein